MSGRKPPWYYPRERIPTSQTLQSWRRRARALAKKVGGRAACGLCKRPMRSWGRLTLRHPRSYGNSRNRNVCISCANMLMHMLDVMEWFGACDHLPVEEWPGFVDPEEVERAQDD